MDGRSVLLHSVTSVAALCLWIFQEAELFEGEAVFLMMTVLFGLYVFMSLYLASVHNRNGIFSYIVILLFFQFFGQVWVGNFSYIFENETHIDWYFMNKSMLLCFFSVLGLEAASQVGLFERKGRKLGAYMFPRIEAEGIYLRRCLIMFLFSTSITVIMLRLGISGYADADAISRGVGAYASFAQYLNYLSAGGSIALYLLFYECLCRPTGLKKMMFSLMLLVSLGGALISGMKKDVFIIFVCLFMIYSLVRKRVNPWFIVVMAISVLVVYQFVDAYRTALRAEDYSGDRLGTFIDVVLGSFSDTGLYKSSEGFAEQLGKFWRRISLVDALAVIVEYKDNVGLDENDPAFLQDLLLLPITVFVPRILMPFKSMSVYGLWVSHTVMGMHESIISSSYVTVEGFFYLAGGILLLPIGFFLLGGVLSFWSGFFRLEERSPLFVIIFFLVALRLVEPSTPIDIVTATTRGAIIYTLMGWWLLRWEPGRHRQGERRE